MHEIIPGLWVGDLVSALDTATLKKHGIGSVLTAMRGRFSIGDTFIKHQVQLDDSQDADILMHFLPCIQFIQMELGKGRGVLVHCHAGISRSPTIVAAYLMYTQHANVQDALDIIRQKRIHIDPNENFLAQLEIFYEAGYKVSPHEKAIRKFYMERAAGDIMNGGGILSETTMFANLPQTSPLSTAASTPGESRTRRRIRCKMCRQELATREHMFDHGQPGPASVPLSTANSFSAEGASSFFPDQGTNDSERKSTTSFSGVSVTSEDGKSIEEVVIVKTTASETTTSAEVSKIDSRTVAQSSEELRARLLDLGPNPRDGAGQSSGSLPILLNPKCSGYFVEPMKWMETFLSKGEVAGKITCPNKRCNAKLGNYDWAGVCCGCKEWVIPGFCINRSKVDEVL